MFNKILCKIFGHKKFSYTTSHITASNPHGEIGVGVDPNLKLTTYSHKYTVCPRCGVIINITDIMTLPQAHQ